MNTPIYALDVRPDEMDDINRFAAAKQCEIIAQSISLAEALSAEWPTTDALSILGTSPVDAATMEELANRGIRFLSTRTVGFDHIDIDAAHKYGVQVAHVTYPPNSVAEYAVMLILMSLRRMKLVMHRASIQDFSLPGSQGRELGNATIGILGTGRIGATVARLVHGFGTRILANDPIQNESLNEIVEYVDLDTMLRESDLVTLHTPSAPENHHLFNAETIQKMKPGSIIVNCGRGDLIDPEALISALESGHISGAALDVVENDLKYFHRDVRLGTIRDRHLMLLRAFPNVLVTPHIAFYTQEVVTAMVEQSMGSLLELRETGTSTFLVS